MTLSLPNQARISSLSRQDVISTLSDLRAIFEESLWVGKKNRYIKDTINIIKAELMAGPIGRPRQLAQYVAASTVLHCSDGWSYLGRALSSLLRGDPHRARHLAYYAELRGAMSLLASVGIGVFNTRHFLINKKSSVEVVPGAHKTHDFVWDCLEFWGDQPSSGDLFSRIVRPEGTDLTQWLDPIGGTAAVAAQAKAWFLQWGMDLRVPHFDQLVRNESSYRPDGLHETWAIDAAEVLAFARDFWSSMEPTPMSRFGNVDRHILRIGIESMFKGTKNKTPSEDPAAFREHVTKVVNSFSFDEIAADRWTKFLLRTTSSADLDILKYSQFAPSIAAKTHFSVFSRAALLLRVASGSVLELMTEAGYSADDMSFWWSSVGNARGIWDGVRGSDAIMDLWADIEPALRSIDDFQQSVPPAQQTFFRAAADIGSNVSHLGSCERIAVWSLTPSAT